MTYTFPTSNYAITQVNQSFLIEIPTQLTLLEFKEFEHQSG